ncbi:hypothetical protein CKO51_12890 [Rhodopirellula sp. SM50]|nr:iron-containing redox enzyme family protein [Rhodopirellula sp. SM50]PAY19043.1 hypothetical protein CKO51_12890 [Rhodopirellula sp. SM50]
MAHAVVTNFEFLDNLDQLLFEIETEVEHQAYWKTFIAPTTPSSIVLKIMAEVMRDIGSYQLEVNKAVFSAVGRLGTVIDEQGLIRAMIAVQVEEVGHGAIAAADYAILTNNQIACRDSRPTPTAQALIGTVRNLGEREHPLCHLGFMYFFEKFTTLMTEKVAPTLLRAGYPDDRLEFMRLHAEEDVRHADMLANVIAECLNRYDDAASHIQYGFDTFRVVYPHALWNAAFLRATGERVCHD